jgi:hypothetical protein
MSSQLRHAIRLNIIREFDSCEVAVIELVEDAGEIQLRAHEWTEHGSINNKVQITLSEFELEALIRNLQLIHRCKYTQVKTL